MQMLVRGCSSPSLPWPAVADSLRMITSATPGLSSSRGRRRLSERRNYGRDVDTPDGEGRNAVRNVGGESRSNVAHASRTISEGVFARNGNSVLARTNFASHIVIEKRKGLHNRLGRPARLNATGAAVNGGDTRGFVAGMRSLCIPQYFSRNGESSGRLSHRCTHDSPSRL